MDRHLRSMSVDELWLMREEVSSTLARKIVEETVKLEERLRLLEKPSRAIGSNNHNRPRRARKVRAQAVRREVSSWLAAFLDAD